MSFTEILWVTLRVAFFIAVVGMLPGAGLFSGAVYVAALVITALSIRNTIKDWRLRAKKSDGTWGDPHV